MEMKNIKKCDFCNDESEISTNNHNYCFKHYVEDEPDECLSSDIYYHLYIQKDIDDLTEEDLELNRKLIRLIIKKYPNILEDFHGDIEKYLDGKKVSEFKIE